MATFAHRYPLNVPGKFYVDDQCTDCDLCRELAPANVRRDDRTGQSYVFKQPGTEEETQLLMEGVRGCPTEGVGADGDQFDWATTPILNWEAVLARFREERIEFPKTATLISIETTDAERQRVLEVMRLAKFETKPSLWRRVIDCFFRG